MEVPGAKELFAQASRAESAIDLFECALCVARVERGEFDQAAARRRVDVLVAGARQCLRGLEANSRSGVQALSEHLFVEEQFKGDDGDYYDPRNSCLDQVLERRVGIPITLALLYCQVARAVGVPAYEISYPGRFLVGIDLANERILVDCFGGAEVDERWCSNMLRTMYEGKLQHTASMLERASRRSIVLRMLINLQGAHIRRRDVESARRYAELLVALDGEVTTHRRDRGLLAYEAGDMSAAAQDLAEYIRTTPTAPDLAVARRHLMEARARIANLS